MKPPEPGNQNVPGSISSHANLCFFKQEALLALLQSTQLHIYWGPTTHLYINEYQGKQIFNSHFLT